MKSDKTPQALTEDGGASGTTVATHPTLATGTTVATGTTGVTGTTLATNLLVATDTPGAPTGPLQHQPNDPLGVLHLPPLNAPVGSGGLATDGGERGPGSQEDPTNGGTSPPTATGQTSRMAQFL